MSHRLKIIEKSKKNNLTVEEYIKEKPAFEYLSKKITNKRKKFNYLDYFDEYSDKVKDLLKLRKEMNLYKPGFRRYKSATIKRISDSWRHPRGLQSKARIQKKGTPRHPKIGYSKPKLVRNLNEKGCKEILIFNKKQILDLIQKGEKIMIVLSKKLGMKKKLELENLCKENSLFVKNQIKIEKYL